MKGGVLQAGLREGVPKNKNLIPNKSQGTNSVAVKFKVPPIISKGDADSTHGVGGGGGVGEGTGGGRGMKSKQSYSPVRTKDLAGQGSHPFQQRHTPSDDAVFTALPSKHDKKGHVIFPFQQQHSPSGGGSGGGESGEGGQGKGDGVSLVGGVTTLPSGPEASTIITRGDANLYHNKRKKTGPLEAAMYHRTHKKRNKTQVCGIVVSGGGGGGVVVGGGMKGGVLQAGLREGVPPEVSTVQHQ